MRSITARGELVVRKTVFALRIIRLVESLPNPQVAKTIGGQLLRCGTSVGANHRAVRRARSPAEFRAKLGIVEEEADESVYWMELLIGAEIIRHERLADLIEEANEILAMVVASIKTSKTNQTKPCPPHSALRTPRSALDCLGDNCWTESPSDSAVSR